MPLGLLLCLPLSLYCLSYNPTGAAREAHGLRKFAAPGRLAG